MEAFKCLLDEIEMAFRLGDLDDWESGHAAVREGVAALSREPDPSVRMERGLGALRVLRTQHERMGRTALAADAARLIGEIERRMSRLVELNEAELLRRRETCARGGAITG